MLPFSSNENKWKVSLWLPFIVKATSIFICKTNVAVCVFVCAVAYENSLIDDLADLLSHCLWSPSCLKFESRIEIASNISLFYGDF